MLGIVLFLKNNWEEVGIFLVASVFAITIVTKNAEISSLKLDIANKNAELARYKDSLAFQNSQILANKQDENKTAELPKIIHDIQTRTVVVTKEITKFKEDTNVSKDDCNASINFINGFDYSLQ